MQDILIPFSGDKSTVVSIVPFPIMEFKPGLYPGNFNIGPCLDENVPKTLVVGGCIHLMYIPDQPLPVRIEKPSWTVAQAIVNDYLDGQMYSVDSACPGITWLPDEVSIATFITKYKEAHDKLKAVQRAWAVELIKRTDDDWNKYHSYRVASDPAKFFAKLLGVEPPWMQDDKIGFGMDKCPACLSMVDKGAIICAACKCVLDEKRYKTMVFAV